jgi:O-antigen/teichoic acid export membrane protein
LTVLVFGVYYLFTQAMLPKLARMGLSASLRVFRWTKLLTGLGAVCALLLAVLAEPIVAVVYGTSMIGAAPILRLLALTIPLEFALAFMGTALVAWGRERLVLVLAGGGLILNVLLNIAVIPPFGASGAAQVKVVTYLIVVALLGAAIRGARFTERLTHFLDGSSPK